MLPVRTGIILNHIVSQYIDSTVPVASQNIAANANLGVSSATIRNEVAFLERDGFIIRPHTSAGSVPSDKGYRYYVDLLGKTELPEAEQRLVSHLFHQVEREVEKWLSLTATLLAQLVRNVAVVTMPKSADCKFKHVELLPLQDRRILLVLLLYGAKVRQKLISATQELAQAELTIISNKLNAAYSGLTRHQISTKKMSLAPDEQQASDSLIEMMRAEDEQEYDDPYLDGLHFTLNQPEFAHSDRMRALMEMVEYRNLLKNIIPAGMKRDVVHVVIGKENKAEAIQSCSVVISQYGLPNEAVGAIGVIGPTRMPYYHTIPMVNYLSSVLSGLMARLYGKETLPSEPEE